MRRSSRKWPAITSSARCALRSARPYGQPSCSGRAQGCPTLTASTRRAAGRVESPVTTESEWSGTPRGPARASRWPSTREQSSESRRWRTRTIVVLTDRNDLDDQLFGTFSRCQDLLRQPPSQAESRADLRSKLSVNAGGVVFTTIQKFFPEEKGDTHPILSKRRNIVVIADEAHRSQYDFIDGYARHMRDALPNASFVGFTGTPIELRGRQHPRRLWRLHQHLRHSALCRGRCHGAHLLREPPS